MTARTLVIGVGNPDRGDDAVGLHVARRVAAAAPQVSVIEAAGDALRLLDRWRGAEHVVLDTGSAAGHQRGISFQ